MSSNLNHYANVDDRINVYENADNIELNSIYSRPLPLQKTLTVQNEYYHQNERFRLIK